MIEAVRRIVEKKEVLAAGVMSGTSLDGIDVALCRIAGVGRDTRIEVLHFVTLPYSDREREDLLRLCTPGGADVAALCRANKALGVRIGHAVLEAVSGAGLRPADVDFVSSHGQTVHHAPEEGCTLQIGELADIAAVTGLPTVGDFRPSDMAYGGEGAPFVPFVDRLLYASDRASRLLINIGGIGNVTALPRGGAADGLRAFDTGPGNVLIDSLMKLHGDGDFDEDGRTAARGAPSQELLDFMIGRDAFLPRPAPKSTGRELYTVEYAERVLRHGESLGLTFPDVVATVTDFTAYAIGFSARTHVPFPIDEFYVSGGGAHNPFMMRRLAHHLGAEAYPLERLGMSVDAKEAAAFAILGNEFLHGRFNNARSATGADRDVLMGKLALPSPSAGAGS